LRWAHPELVWLTCFLPLSGRTMLRLYRIPIRVEPHPWRWSLDLRHLNTFCAVMETGGFSRAADRLYLAQSAVSTHIRHIEDVLSTVLFERHPNGIRPTQAAVVLYEYARRLLALADEMRE
jgi:hypothetical protein